MIRTVTAIEDEILYHKRMFDIFHLATVHPLHKAHKLPAWYQLNRDIAPLVAELAVARIHAEADAREQLARLGVRE